MRERDGDESMGGSQGILTEKLMKLLSLGWCARVDMCVLGREHFSGSLEGS